jgi:hypothetical protein
VRQSCSGLPSLGVRYRHRFAGVALGFDWDAWLANATPTAFVWRRTRSTPQHVLRVFENHVGYLPQQRGVRFSISRRRLSILKERRANTAAAVDPNDYLDPHQRCFRVAGHLTDCVLPVATVIVRHGVQIARSALPVRQLWRGGARYCYAATTWTLIGAGALTTAGF